MGKKARKHFAIDPPLGGGKASRGAPRLLLRDYMCQPLVFLLLPLVLVPAVAGIVIARGKPGQEA